MTYITTTEGYGGRRDRKIDLDRFAADLARELGCPAPEGGDDGWPRTIRYGGDVLTICANDWKGRINVHIDAPEIGHDDRNHYDKTHRTATATVNPDGRPIAAIAKDIKRRVIAASAAALAVRREYAAAKKASRVGFAATVAELKAAMPYLDIRSNDREERAAIYSGGTDGLSGLDATLTSYGGGTIDIRHLHNLTPAKFRAVIELLRGKHDDAP